MWDRIGDVRRDSAEGGVAFGLRKEVVGSKLAHFDRSTTSVAIQNSLGTFTIRTLGTKASHIVWASYPPDVFLCAFGAWRDDAMSVSE